MAESLLTWLDVERVFKKHTSHGTRLPAGISGVRCYATGAELDYQDDKNAARQWLAKIFGSNFDSDRSIVRLGFGGHEYPIQMEQTDEAPAGVSGYPLWADIAYLSGDAPATAPTAWKDGPRISAFHSFKGGVGRTTALANYVAAALDAKKGESVRILIVDADFEAPGISFWLDDANKPKVSFAQFMEALHYPPGSVTEALNYFADELRKTSLDIEGAKRELFVLPSASSINSMMDMPVRPEHLARNSQDPWRLSEYLRSLGQLLEVDHIFVDLRAGLSELSSSLLFDPRIEHFFVTTVAPQSIKGMSMILERLYAFQNRKQNSREIRPTVILTMLTPQLRELPEYGEAQQALGQAYPNAVEDVLSPGFELIECDFSPSLMSIKSLREAIQASRDISTLYQEALSWAEAYNIEPDRATTGVQRASDPQGDARKLHELCSRVQFAEQITAGDMLATEPLRNFGKHFSAELPSAVSVGAKGAGKTFTYLQVCRAETWVRFLNQLEVRHSFENDGKASIFPVLWSDNLGVAARDVVTDCQLRAAAMMPNANVEGRTEIERRIRQALSSGGQDWGEFWDGLICRQLGVDGDSLKDANKRLGEVGREFVLVFDGLEDVFEDPQNEQAREALKALLQLPNRLAELRERRLGAIVFVRADYVQAAIRQNVSQFLARFSPFSLEWSPESFLRLAYWLCGQSQIIGAKPELAEELTIPDLLDALMALWGKKLGRPDSKEARSALWVFGVLCDLKGQIQARDLVRFLRFAAEIQKGKAVTAWPDRVLAPESIRQAIQKCSNEKVQEAVKEISVLGAWKDRLDAMNPSERKVPFDPTALALDQDTLRSLSDLGIIYEDTDQKDSVERFYLPEIYRQGLKFETTVGGRPRTLALLKKNLPRLPF